MGTRMRGEAVVSAARRRRRIALPLFLAAVIGLLVGASSAQASFHLIKVREVYPGSNNDSYVELQMYEAGQEFVLGHSMTLYDSSGTLTHTSTFASNVASGTNQATLLIGDTNTQSAFGVAPDLVDSGLDIPAGGGAVCWNAGGAPADCVAWGNFSGGQSFATATNTTVGTAVSAGGITAGKAIRRKISPGCSTLLESADDTDNSATDFEEITPAPRNNSSTITEHPCTAPDTSISSASVPNQGKTNSTAISFTFSATPSSGSTFECKLDGLAFEVCPSPKEYTALTGNGSASGTGHTFQVRAINGGTRDPTPAMWSWTVDTVAPSTTITHHPEDPSRGTGAKFEFTANESVTGFQCSLAKVGEPDSFSVCTSGKTYTGLADGEYTFKVKATADQAGNPGEPASYTWTVDNSLPDTEPPETTIVSKPPDPSGSATASFTYESNEPGSTFECKLDAGEFAACPPTGITYTGLANGSHTFEVRAVDASNNVDPSPAGYTFSVVVPIAGSPAPAPQPPAPPAVPEPPETKLVGKPPAKTRDRTPTFRFRSSSAGASYMCKLDHGPFKRCRSPFTTKALSPGRHTLEVKAIAGGLTDPTPVKYTFRVVKG